MKLEQEKQFKVTKDAVAGILKHYGQQLVTYKAASSGIENTTLIVESNTQKLVVRIYRHNKKPVSEIELEINFMQYLHNQHIKVPTVFSNARNKVITNINRYGKEWHVIAMEYADGDHAQNYSIELIKDMAQCQANMHIASSNYTGLKNPPKLGNVLKENYFLPLIDTTNLAEPEILDFINRGGRYRVDLSNDLPAGLCHLDYDKDNIVSSSNQVSAILDFDDLAHAPFVVCLGYTLWHIWRYAGKQMAGDYLNEYATIRPLSKEEIQLLSPVIAFRHYMISNLKILNGHTSKIDSNNYINLEKEITSLAYSV